MRSGEERWAGDRAGPAPPPAARPAPLQKRRREPPEPQDYSVGSAGKGSAAAAGEARLQVGNLGEQSWAAAEGSAEPPASSGGMERAPGTRRRLRAGWTCSARHGRSVRAAARLADPRWWHLRGSSAACRELLSPPNPPVPGVRAPPGARGSPEGRGCAPAPAMLERAAAAGLSVATGFGLFSPS